MEALVAILVAGVTVAAIVGAFVRSFRASVSTHYSGAAQLLAVQGLERVRAARWDAVTYPVVDEVVSANFPATVAVLDRDPAGTNSVLATNFTTITTISTNPWVKLIRVDCVYGYGGSARPITNTLISYRGTETGQQNLVQSAPPATPTPPPPPSGTTATSNNRGSGDDDDDDDGDDDDGGDD
jgi:hypothetical protein